MPPSSFDFPINIWLFNIAMENPPIFKFGKPSISMGHGFHGYVSHNQRVTYIDINIFTISSVYFIDISQCRSDTYRLPCWSTIGVAALAEFLTSGHHGVETWRHGFHGKMVVEVNRDVHQTVCLKRGYFHVQYCPMDDNGSSIS